MALPIEKDAAAWAWLTDPPAEPPLVEASVAWAMHLRCDQCFREAPPDRKQVWFLIRRRGRTPTANLCSDCVRAMAASAGGV